jgi:HSP20 family protein
MGTNLKQFAPLSEISRLDPFEGMDEWFRGWNLRPALRDFKVEPRIKMDVHENEKEYTVHAEMPGVSKDQIKVSVDGNQVCISAELKKESEEKSKTCLRSERYFGSQSRAFTLEHEIDDAAVVARYTDGVLDLTLPKKPGSVSKQIKIN